MKIALFAPGVVAGIWGAMLSSALGGILGGPRILQAMSTDRITPRFFGKGVGLNNEPRNALILTVLIAEGGILIGELDLIARVVSMFYLAAYGFINISFFLESWASADFNPSFKVRKWVGMLGAIATFAVMFKLDMLAMFAAFILIGGIYLWLGRKQVALRTGDVWQSVWSTVVKTGLKQMEAKEDHKRNWKPNIILFSGSTAARPHLMEFGKTLAGQIGMVTNFDLVENQDAKVLFPKHKQTVQDELLQQYGIFGRQMEVQNVFKGIETIASTFGFSGIDPNTVLMGWAKNTKDPIWFAQMTQKLIDLDYNVLYLDYDNRWGFRKKEKIDLWWRGFSNNAEIMINLCKFITSTPGWRNTTPRVLLVNDSNVDRNVIENRIVQLLDKFRMKAEIHVINNFIEKRPFYELMKVHSMDADLVMIGIPTILPGEESEFVERTNNLVKVIGTTLLIKASTTFDVSDFGLKNIKAKPLSEKTFVQEIESLTPVTEENLSVALENLDSQLENAAISFSQSSLSQIAKHYNYFFTEANGYLKSMFEKIEKSPDRDLIFQSCLETLKQLRENAQHMSKEELDSLKEVLKARIADYLKSREYILENAPANISIKQESKEQKVKWSKTLYYYENLIAFESIFNALEFLEDENVSLLTKCRMIITEHLSQMLEKITPHDSNVQMVAESKNALFKDMEKLMQMGNNLVQDPLHCLRSGDRRICNSIANEFLAGRSDRIKRKRINRKQLKKLIQTLKHKDRSWHEKQLHSHQIFEIALALSETSLSLKMETDKMIEECRFQFITPLKSRIKIFETELTQLHEKLKDQKFQELKSEVFHSGDEEYYHPDEVISLFDQNASALTNLLPGEIELLEISIDQNKKLERKTKNLQVDKITDYLIGTNLIAPLQEELSTLCLELNKVKSKITNSANLIAYSLENSQPAENYAELKDILQNSSEDYQSSAKSMDVLFRRFQASIKDKLEKTSSALEINSILEQSEQLSQYVRKEMRRKGIESWLKSKEEDLRSKRTQVLDFVEGKKQEVLLAKFEKQHASLQSIPTRIREFMDDISLRESVEENLPFYYKQLFMGNHKSPGKRLDNRKREIREAKKIIRWLRGGSTGAIMVCGESLSGKSYLSELIAHQLIGKQEYHINAPFHNKRTKADLTKAFQLATGRKGSLYSILNSLPAESVFILNDIEFWWLKSSNTNEALMLLIEAIKAYGNKHYFLLNSDFHSFELICSLTDLRGVLVSTIFIAPMSRPELQELLWTRHKTGGLLIEFEEKGEEELKEKKLAKLMSKFHSQSGGKPGWALLKWLSSIKNYQDGLISLESPIEKEFPAIEDPQWKSIILQFILHRRLSRQDFEALFESEGKDWISNKILELKKSGIIEEPAKEVYQLKNAIRPYLEEWLKEMEVLAK